jgi:hypothetical protein
MAIIRGFKSTTVWRAFILNALATSVAISVAILIKTQFSTYTDQYGHVLETITTIKDIAFTFLITFLATYLAYLLLYIIFGYGGGMLTITTH